MRIDKRLRILGPDDGQAIRLPEVGRDLRDELVRPETDRAGEALLREDLHLQPPDMALGPVQVAEERAVDVGLVEARRLEGIGARGDDGQEPFGDLTIARPVARTKTVSGSPRRRAASAGSQAREIGSAPAFRSAATTTGRPRSSG